MPDKIFTPYTLGCPKCREEFNYLNNTPTQVRELGKERACPDNTLTVTVSPNDLIYKNTGCSTVTVHCSKHKEHITTMYAYDYDGIEEISYARFDQYKFDCIVHYCEKKGIKLPPLEELEKYHPARLHNIDFDENDFQDPYKAEAVETKKFEAIIADIYNQGNDYDEEGNYIPVANREHHLDLNKDIEGN